MIDIEKFITSLKASWIKRLFYSETESQLKCYYDQKLDKYGGYLIFESSLSKPDVHVLFNKCKFLKDIILSWIKIKNPDNNFDKDRDILWNNSNIKVNKRTVFYKNWFDKGIKLIKNLYDYRTKNFYSFKDMMFIFDIPKTDFLKYNSLKYNIPKEYKKLLMQTETNQEIQTSILEKLVNSKQVNKTLYLHQFKNEQYTITKSEQKWTKLFENSDLNWSKIYTNVLSATIDIKLRNFQYKFLHRIIPTNKLLFKQNIAAYSICDFCSMHIETLEHLFWECNIVQVFWSNFSNRCSFLNMNF